MDKAKQEVETINYLGKFMYWIPTWKRKEFYEALEKTIQERVENEVNTVKR